MMRVNMPCNECSCREVCKYISDTDKLASELKSIHSCVNINSIDLKCSYFSSKYHSTISANNSSTVNMPQNYQPNIICEDSK